MLDSKQHEQQMTTFSSKGTKQEDSVSVNGGAVQVIRALARQFRLRLAGKAPC